MFYWIVSLGLYFYWMIISPRGFHTPSSQCYVTYIWYIYYLYLQLALPNLYFSVLSAIVCPCYLGNNCICFSIYGGFLSFKDVSHCHLLKPIILFILLYDKPFLIKVHYLFSGMYSVYQSFIVFLISTFYTTYKLATVKQDVLSY